MNRKQHPRSYHTSPICSVNKSVYVYIRYYKSQDTVRAMVGSYPQPFGEQTLNYFTVLCASRSRDKGRVQSPV